MKADEASQRRLLDLQALDTRLGQIAHRRGKLPQQQVLDAALAEKGAVDTDLIKARTQQSDVRREVAKAESDVQLVRDRAARDRERMAAGGGAKELQSLQHELDSLARRQAELEDDQLAVMERAEGIDALVAHLEQRSGELGAAVATAESARDAAVGELDAEAGRLRDERATVTPDIAAPLLDLYEKVRLQTGMGAAAVVQRRCEGCRLELLGADVARIKAAPADEVVRCEECRRILVRTAESGL